MNKKITLTLLALFIFFITGMSFGQITVNGQGSYATIQAAVDAASPGDVIVVPHGTYAGATVNKSLTIKGEQYNNDARIRGAVSETIIDNAGGGFGIAANNVEINGFTIQGTTNSNAAPGFGYAVYMAPGTTGTRILNNIIKNNIIGASLSNTGAVQVVIQKNWFDSNNQEGPSGGSGIYTDEYVSGGPVSNVLIDNNKFTNNASQGICLSPADPAKGISGITISNNEFAGNARAAFLYTVVNSSFSNNQISGSTQTGTGDLRIYGSVNNLSVQNNIFAGGVPKPIVISDDGNGHNNSAITVNNNSFAASYTGLIGINSGYTGALNCSGNWWGSNVEATFTPKFSGSVDYSPWLNTGTDTAPGTFGFQGDFSDLKVSFTSPGSTVQEAIDAMPPTGGTLNLFSNANEYEPFTINKPVTIIGNGGNVIVRGHSPAITINATGVSISGIIFKDVPAADYAVDVANGPYNVTISSCYFLTAKGIKNQGSGTVTANDNYWGTILQDKITLKISGNVVWTNWQGKTVSPVNGLTGVTIGLDKITWTAFEKGSYDFTIYEGGRANGPNPGTQIAGHNITTTDLFANIVSPQPADAALSMLPLKNNTIYYWYIKPTDLGVEYWDELHFTTIPSVDITLNNPADQSAVYTTSVMFNWNTSQTNNGLTFVLQLWQHDNLPTETEWANNAAQFSVTTTYKTVNGLFAGKPYYWRVLAKKTSTNELVSYSQVYSFNTTGGSTVTVTPSWPVGGSTVYTNSPTLYWYLDQAATGLTYKIKYNPNSGVVGGDGELTDGISVFTSSSNLYYTLPNLAPGTTYFWQVKAIYSAGASESAWSAPESFTTQGRGTLMVPIASYPVDGEIVYTTSPNVHWYLGTAASGLYYDIDIATAHNGQDGTAEFSTTTADQLYKKITGLTPGQTYYYKLRSKNVVGAPLGSQASVWSDEATFTVAGGTNQSYPVASEPVGNPTVYSARPMLSWYLEGSSLGITGYKVKYTKNQAAGTWNNTQWTNFDPGTPNDATDGQATRTLNQTTWTINADLTYGATYHWAVSAVSSGSESVYSVGSFTVVGGAGQGDPIQSQPEDGSVVYSTSVRLSWFVNGTTTGISDYELVYSKSDLFDPAVTTTVHPTTQYYNATSLTPGATYYWKVQARYPGGILSNVSPVWSFTVQVGSSPVVQPLVGGPNNVVLNTTAPMLTWVLPAQTSANLQYEVEVADNLNFSDAKVINASNKNVQVNSLIGNKSYFWRVRSKSNDGSYSYYSNTGKFSVDKSATGVEHTKEIPTQFILDQNYPNPFNPTTMIRFALPKDAYVSLKIYNVLGQEVKTLMSEYRSAGTYNVQWNGDDNSGKKVQSGTYVYRIVAGDNVSAKKMLMIK